MKASASQRLPSNPLPLPAADAARGMRWLYTLVLLWLAGAAMRITVLAVPPVLPQMQRDLAMSQIDIGVLSSLPSLLFAIVAIPGAALIVRFGALPTLIGGLLVTAAGGAVRGIAPDTLILFATTFVMSAGIAVMQPALPRIVRDWAPQRVGFATAVYANGMLAAEALAASLTIPFVLPLAGGSWRWSLAFWSLPVVLIAWLLAAEGARRRAIAMPVRTATRDPQRWWPDWRDPLTWEIGLAMGCASGIYFGVNAFLPGYLTGSGRAGSVDGALAAINVSQIPATVILFFCAQRLSVKRIPYVVTGIAATVGVVG
ncbi:MAG: CynX/NimT family MFS transporter, partial [Rhodanobacteraceae bacterium]